MREARQESKSSRSEYRSTGRAPDGYFGGRFNRFHQSRPGTRRHRGAGRNKIRLRRRNVNLCVQGATHWTRSGTRFTRPTPITARPQVIEAKGWNVLVSKLARQDERRGGAARHRPPPWLGRAKDGEVSPTRARRPREGAGIEIRRAEFVITAPGHMTNSCLKEAWGAMRAATEPG